MTRFRELIPIADHLPPGPLNAITDVPGVRVGHITRIEGDGKLIPGKGPIRSGLTAILPHAGNLFREKVPAAVYTINGYGKATGFEQVRELGLIETPICLSNTLNVGKVWDAVLSYAIRENPDIAITTSNVNPVVGECNDNFLSDGQGRHISESDTLRAIDGARAGRVAEGCVGAGVGTLCYGFKGGIGTASRRVIDGAYTVAALLQTNFGQRHELRILGAPIGRRISGESVTAPPGSVMIVIATNAPLDSRQLGRMAKRAPFGLGRTGTICHSGSGDFVIAFSICNRRAHDASKLLNEAPLLNEEALFHGKTQTESQTGTQTGPLIDQFFRAVVECVEESVYNALVAARTTVGRDGNTLYALPHDQLLALMRHYQRLE